MSEQTTAVCPLCHEIGHRYGRNCPALQKNDEAVKVLLVTRLALREVLEESTVDFARFDKDEAACVKAMEHRDSALNLLKWPAKPLP